MGRNMPPPSPGSERDNASRAIPSHTQTAFDWSARALVGEDTTALYAAFAAAVRAAGGVEWLAAALDREPSYSSKLSEGTNRRDGRHVHLDWLAPLLSDERAISILAEFICDRGGYEPPKKKRVASKDELLTALLDELGEANGVGKAVIERAAKRLGTDSGAFRK
jgi:hypothetical protein